MKILLCCVAVVGGMAGPLLGQNAASDAVAEERARMLLVNGVRLMGAGNHREALRDFSDVVTGYPGSAVADDALVEIARYHLEVSLDPVAAKAAVDQLLGERYRSSDSVAVAYVLSARTKLMASRAAESVGSALTDFDRVRMFGETDVLPNAMYHAGETLNVVHRPHDALQRYQEVLSEYPRAIWAARSSLGAARALVQLGQPDRAMAVLQRVRATHRDTTYAAQALAWNSILYRLHVRSAARGASHAFADRILTGADGRIKDVVALEVDRNDSVFAVQKNGAAVFDGAGKLVRVVPAVNARGLFVDRQGRPVLVLKGSLHPEGAAPAVLAVPKSDGNARPLEDVTAAVLTSFQEVLVPDRGSRSISRFSTSAKFIAPFAQGDADRLAINWRDDIAALDREAKAVTVFNADGKILYRVAQRTADYELRDPVDVAFDPLGYLYVLDRNGERSAVLAFAPSGKLVTRFTAKAKTQGAFEDPAALAVDSAGRVFIYDEKKRRVQVYQ